MEAGHSLTELARLLGKPRTSFRRSLSRPSVTAQTAMSVKTLYEGIMTGDPCPQVHPDPSYGIAEQVTVTQPGGGASQAQPRPNSSAPPRPVSVLRIRYLPACRRVFQ
jgi:hypothetical protein